MTVFLHWQIASGEFARGVQIRQEPLRPLLQPFSQLSPRFLVFDSFARVELPKPFIDLLTEVQLRQ
jgi:hypothetical protein